ncbi:MAG: hypothetical protein PGN26_11175 [Xylophilus ampelinus]
MTAAASAAGGPAASGPAAAGPASGTAPAPGPGEAPALRIDRATALLLLALQDEGAAVSVPRLGKRLGEGASVLMRRLAATGDAAVGGRPGPGWTRLEHQGDRWMAGLTDAGRDLAQRLRALVEAAPASDGASPDAGAAPQPGRGADASRGGRGA